MRFILRLIWVLLAIIFAGLVGVAVLTAGGASWLGADYARELEVTGDPLAVFITQAWGAISFLAFVGPALTVLPGLLLVLVGEVARIRTMLYYVVGGGIAMAIIPVLASSSAGTPGALPAERYLLLFSAAGFVGGFTYWLLAGRKA